MTRLEKLETDVAGLSTEDLFRFRDWFAAYDSDAFDDRIHKEAISGKLDALAETAPGEFQAGLARPL